MKTDISVAIKYFDLYYFLAKQDLKNRFRRSYLGISWVIIHQLTFSLVAGFIWAKLWGIEASNFISFLTIGSVIWAFIASSLTEGCTTFITAQGYLKQIPLPQSIFIFRTMLTAFFYLGVGISTAVVVLLLFNKFKLASLFYMLPGMAILICYFYGTSGVMAYLGLRYRDLQHAITSLLSLIFIITPVLYPPEVLVKKGVGFVLYLNPLGSLIEIIRYPLLNYGFAETKHYLITLTLVSLTLLFKFWLKKNWGRYVPFWA